MASSGSTCEVVPKSGGCERLKVWMNEFYLYTESNLNSYSTSYCLEFLELDESFTWDISKHESVSWFSKTCIRWEHIVKIENIGKYKNTFTLPLWYRKFLEVFLCPFWTIERLCGSKNVIIKVYKLNTMHSTGNNISTKIRHYYYHHHISHSSLY